jgi:hypothetical protein
MKIEILIRCPSRRQQIGNRTQESGVRGEIWTEEQIESFVVLCYLKPWSWLRSLRDGESREERRVPRSELQGTSVFQYREQVQL